MMGRIAYGCLVLGAVFLMIMYDGYPVFLASLAVIAAPFPAALLLFLLRKHLRLTWQVPSSAVREETITITAAVTGPFLSYLPALSATLGGRAPAAAARTKKQILFTFSMVYPHAGSFPFPDGVVRLTDPMGLFSFSLRGNAPENIIILPRRIGTFPAASKLLASYMGAGDVEYYGATPYHAGDDLRRINWKATARKDDLYIRDKVPAAGTDLVMAADLPPDEDLRDIVGDALLTAASALLAGGKSFTFLWRSRSGAAVMTAIATEDAFRRSLLAFLTKGSAEEPFTGTALPPDQAVCWISGCKEAKPPSGRPVFLWSALPDARGAVLSGRAAITDALGGKS